MRVHVFLTIRAYICLLGLVMCQRLEMTLYNNCRELIVICLVTVQQFLLVVDSASEGIDVICLVNNSRTTV